MLTFQVIDDRADRSRLYFCNLPTFSRFIEVLPPSADHAIGQRIDDSLLIDICHAPFLELYIGLSPQPLLLTLNQMEMPIGRIILKDLQTIVNACIIAHRPLHIFYPELPQLRIRGLFAFFGRCPAGLALALRRQDDAFLLARGDLIMHSL